jgi:hypothetical protein
MLSEERVLTVYTYVVGGEGELCGRVMLTFEDGHFKGMKHTIDEEFIGTPEYWRVMGDVYTEIRRIELQSNRVLIEN